MGDPDCPRGHVWVMTHMNARVWVCKNCGKDEPVTPLPYNDPLMVEERRRTEMQTALEDWARKATRAQLETRREEEMSKPILLRAMIIVQAIDKEMHRRNGGFDDPGG